MRLGILAALAALAVSFGAATLNTATVHADEVGGEVSFSTPCDVRAGQAIVYQLYNSEKPDHLTWAQWLHGRANFHQWVTMSRVQSPAYQQGNDVCNRGEALIATGLWFIVQTEFIDRDPWNVATPKQCNGGEEANVFYNNHSGIEGDVGAAGLSSVWSDGTSWDSECYVNPFDILEADTGRTAADYWNRYFPTLGVPDVISAEDFAAVYTKRYVDPTITPCSLSNTVYDPCRLLPALGVTP